MERKSQISAFLVIGLFIILIFSLYFLSKSKINPENSNTNKLSLMRIEEFSLNCLRQSTLNAIENQGLMNSSLIENIISEDTKDCINSLDEIEESTEIEANTQIELTDEIIFVEFDYPIQIVDSDSVNKLQRLSFELDSQAIIKTNNGKIIRGSLLTSVDNKFSLAFSKDTSVIKGREQVPFVSLKLLDKNNRNMTNRAVVGSVIYEGFPDGATFEPTVEASILLEGKDLIGINPESLRLAYFDEEAGIWIAYPGSWFDEKSMTIRGNISHFTIISVSICAGIENEAIIPLNYVVKDPFQDENYECNPKHWTYNYVYPNKIGFHVLPEFMESFSCRYLTDDMSVFADGKKLEDDSCTNPEKGFIKDWDHDDIPGAIPVYIHASNAIENSYLRDWLSIYYLPGGPEETEWHNILDNMCYESCKELAMVGLKEEFPWITDEHITGDGISDLVDSLNCNSNIFAFWDYEALKKAFDERSFEVECYVPEYQNNLVKKSIQFGDNIGEIKTMEWYRGTSGTEITGKRDGFYATPATFGFEYIPKLNSDILVTEPYGYTASGEFTFNIKPNGDFCADSQEDENLIGQIKGSLILNEVGSETKEFLFNDLPQSVPISVSDDLFKQRFSPNWLFMQESSDELKENGDWSCSDKCTWSLNDEGGAVLDETGNVLKQTDPMPGQLREGTNTLKVIVENINDPCIYAQGYMKLVGSGLEVEKPKNKAECENPKSYDSLTKFEKTMVLFDDFVPGADSCWIPNGDKGICVLNGEWYNGLCCFGRLQGNYPYAQRTHLEKFNDKSCTINSDNRPNTEESCLQKQGLWQGNKCYMLHEYDPYGEGICVFSGNDPFDIDKKYEFTHFGTLPANGECPCNEDDPNRQCLSAELCEGEQGPDSKKCSSDGNGGFKYCCKPKGWQDIDTEEIEENDLCTSPATCAINSCQQGSIELIPKNCPDSMNGEQQVCCMDQYGPRTENPTFDGIMLVEMINACYKSNGNKNLYLLRNCLSEEVKKRGLSEDWDSVINGYGFSDTCNTDYYRDYQPGLQCVCFMGAIGTQAASIKAKTACELASLCESEGCGYQVFTDLFNTKIKEGDLIVFGPCSGEQNTRGHISYILNADGFTVTLLEANYFELPWSEEKGNIPDSSRIVNLLTMKESVRAILRP